MVYSKSFANIYNKKWRAFSLLRATAVKNFLNNQSLSPKNCLDVACGTGLFLRELEKEGIDCCGIDISEHMIKLAKRNTKNSSLQVANMVDFKLDKEFDLVTCNYDSINHLTSLEEWGAAFENVYNHLAEGGLFIFDFHPVGVFEEGEFLLTSDATYDRYEKIVKQDENSFLLSFKIYVKSIFNLYKRVEFEQIETAFESYTVYDLLKKAGFSDIKFTDRNLNETKPAKDSRNFVICYK